MRFGYLHLEKESSNKHTNENSTKKETGKPIKSVSRALARDDAQRPQTLHISALSFINVSLGSTIYTQRFFLLKTCLIFVKLWKLERHLIKQYKTATMRWGMLKKR